jgi:hypothetical protein
MGPERYQRKLMKANITLSSLKYDMGIITTPSLRKFVMSQVLARQFQIRTLEEKINIDKQAQLPVTQPLPEKKAPPSKPTMVVNVKKRVDGQNRIHV